MKKTIIAGILSLFAVVASAETNLYAVGTVSRSQLDYDVNSWEQRQLDKGHRRESVGMFEALGGRLDTTKDLIAPSYKVALGYTLDNKSAVEVSLRKYSTMSLSANARINKHFDTEDRRSGIASGGFYSATATSKASLFALGTALSVVYKPVFPYYVRLGAEYVNAKVTESTSYDSQYAYSFSLDELSHSRHGSESKSESKLTAYRNVLPLVGIGVEFPISDNVSLRTEYERVGVIKWGFDFYSAALVVRF